MQESNKIKIIADDKIPLLKGVFDDIADVIYAPGKEITNSMVEDADCLIVRTRTKCDEYLLEGSNVSFIATATIGFDHIDTDYCKKKNIAWTNAPGCNSSSVEQYVIASILEITERYDLNPREMTLGVVGAGHVGSKIAVAARALGMEVLENDPPIQRREKSDHFVSLEKIKEESDMISFHVPLNHKGKDKTYQMVNEDFFNDIKKGLILINTSRGEIIKEDVLVEKLSNGQLLTAVVDVWNNEPDINKQLLDHSGIATPHIAGYSVNGKMNGTIMSVRAVSEFFGLGLDNWSPAEPPKPENQKIILDCTGMDMVEIIRTVYVESYSVMEDDTRLRKNPEKFEDLRGSYPQRFEPAMYNLRLINPVDDGINNVMEKLGFSVLELDCFC